MLNGKRWISLIFERSDYEDQKDTRIKVIKTYNIQCLYISATPTKSRVELFSVEIRNFYAQYSFDEFGYLVFDAGKISFTWLGPNPRVNIMDPELVKEILSKNFHFRKLRANPLAKLLANGLASYEDEKWTRHRKLINPAFHIEKLKVNIFTSSFFSISNLALTPKYRKVHMHFTSCIQKYRSFTPLPIESCRI